MPSREPTLDDLAPLVGEWDTEGKHVAIQETINGRASIEWLRGHRFLIWRTENPPGTVPSSISLIGGGDTPGIWPMHYFDERGVHRVYQVSATDHGLRVWRDEPGFRQRGTCSFTDGGAVMHSLWELNEDGTFRRDLEVTYRRRRS